MVKPAERAPAGQDAMNRDKMLFLSTKTDLPSRERPYTNMERNDIIYMLGDSLGRGSGAAKGGAARVRFSQLRGLCLAGRERVYTTRKERVIIVSPNIDGKGFFSIGQDTQGQPARKRGHAKPGV
jgi:hypothetical protein